MLIDVSYILGALILLFFGAEGLVRGSTSLSLRAGLSPLMVGLTIVAFGTSAPEMVVSVEAALAGDGDIAVGNVIGSNTFNIGVILGLTALLCPIAVHRQIIRFDAPFALAVAVLMLLLLADGELGRVEGVLLFTGILCYTGISFVLARRQSGEQAAEQAQTPKLFAHWGVDIAVIAGGLGVLIMGSQLLLEHAVSLALGLGVSQAVIGLTIVAAGTSMPELTTSVVAAIRKQPDIAIANVVGSNIFNILGILGVASMIAPISAAGISSLDYGAMLLFTLLLFPLLLTGRRLNRLEGGILLVVYGGYVYLLWPQ